MSRQVILQGGQLLTMTAGPVLQDADLYITDGRIDSIIPRTAEGLQDASRKNKLYYAQAEIIDCTGLVIMPGLIDSHVHFDTDYMGAFFIASGVTSIRNMRGSAEHLKRKNKVLEGTMTGPYMYTSGPIYDGEDPTIPDNTNVILHTEEDVENAVQNVKENYLWMKTYPSIEPELYKRLMRRCQEEGIGLCGHMTKRMDHRYLADHGYISCEHTSSLPADPDTIKYLAKQGMWLCATHVVCETLPDYVWNGKQLEELEHFRDLPVKVQKSWKQRNEIIIANYRKLNIHPDFSTIIRRAEIFLSESDRIMAGTDCAYPGIIPGFAMAEEIGKLHSVYGMSVIDALMAATAKPADHMGISQHKGRLKPGMDADLLILGGSPLSDLNNLRDIRYVFQGVRSWDQNALQAMLKVASQYDEEISED